MFLQWKLFYLSRSTSLKQWLVMLQVQYNQNVAYNKDKEAGQQKINV